MRKHIILTGIIYFLLNCFFSLWGQTISTQPTQENIRIKLDEGDRLYAEREDLSKAYKAIEKYKEALAIDPNCYEAMWKISKTTFFLAEFLKNKKEKELVVDSGVYYGKRAVAANPKGVEGHFWLGVNYSKVGEVKGILKSISLIGPIKQEMRTSISLDGSYEGAGAYVVLGRVYALVPGIFGGSNKKAKSNLEKARALCPKNAMTLIFLAELYWDMDQTENAVKVLEYLQHMEPDSRWIPETKQKKEYGAQLLAKYKKKLSKKD